MAQLPLVIINPESAAGATRKAWPRIASDLRAQFGSFACAFTERPRHGVELATAAARKGTKLIIACGGDGTISEVANGILLSGYDAELGILPNGTGGDFRRTLCIPVRPRDAARIIQDGRTRQIDVGRITFASAEDKLATTYFLGVASFGMSAEVIGRVKEGGPRILTKGPNWIKGRVTFGVAMLQTALKSPSTRVIVQLDGEVERHLSVANLCVANARYFGGGMKIAPHAKLNDGKFNVISIGDLGALKIVSSAPRIYVGSHLALPDVGHVLAKTIAARPAKKNEVVTVEVDVELAGRLPATFQIVPRALRVRCPSRVD